MTGKIYLRERGELVAMHETPYDAEDVLQALLAEHPDLLAGDQMRADAPRRWLLIAREAGIPDAPGGYDRWAIDHLFVDQDGTPTLIEVKRSTDTRLRREVVGQMLDYAANIVAHWPPGEIRALFEARCAATGEDPDQLVTYLLDDREADVDAFWESVSRALAARSLRLVFVADVIPAELQRIIEYLNESMVRVEVLGVEVKQFTGGGHQTLVPRVVGQTAAAEDLKRPRSASRPARDWNEPTFLAEIAAQSPEGLAVVQALTALGERQPIVRSFGHGQFGPMYVAAPRRDGDTVLILAINTQGRIEVQFNAMARAAPFDSVESRLEFKDRLNAIPGVAIRDDQATNGTWPAFSASLVGPHLATLTSVVEWASTAIGAESASDAG